MSLDLPLIEPFTIARETWTSAHNVFCLVSFGDVVGRGEAEPGERWGESVASVIDQLRAVDVAALRGPFDLDGVLRLLPPGSARAALDIAMHDLAAQLAGVSVSEYLGLGPPREVTTSLTVAINEPDRMMERVRSLANHPILKVKVGFDGDVEIVSAIREVFSGRLRIDANEGWDIPTAIERLTALAACDLELCEQPIPAGNIDALRAISEAVPVAIFADEDALTSRDVARLAQSVAGVNLKLGKTGGIREFVAGVGTARALGLRTMIGCNLESGIGTAAGVSVASLVDFVDLDGPLLLKDDPFPGVSYKTGVVSVPSKPGLGVTGSPQ